MFDLFFEIEEVHIASCGSGTEIIDCIVCRNPKQKDGPCAECATRPFLCLWCYAEREEPIKGSCPNCKRYGVTKMKESEKSSVYVETI